MRSLVCFLCLGWASLAAADPKYYVVVRNVIELEGVDSGIQKEALELLKGELAHQPLVTLDVGVAAGASEDDLRAALKTKKLKGIELSLKILEVDRTLDPPPAGKQYRVLGRGIKLSLFGDTVPDKTLSLGGDGESHIGAEIGKAANVDGEGKKLLLEATKAALAQAVNMTLTKLELPPPAADKKKPKPKK